MNINDISGITEIYRRGILAQITAPTMFDEPGSKVFDEQRGYWRPITHSPHAWPQIEVIPGWLRTERWINRRIRQPWVEARLRVREAKSVLRHGIPERDDW